MKYYPTSLEKWVSNLYRHIGIFNPSDIDERIIAHYFNIYLYYKPIPSSSYENGHFKSITVDKRLPLNVQREVFFHELCHILRHSGWQSSIMPLSFRDYQEWDANKFVRYSSIPFHMLSYIDWDNPCIISQMSDTFKVTSELCEVRINFIKMNSRYKEVIYGESCNVPS